MKFTFKNKEINVHDSWSEFFNSQLEELTKIESLIGDDFTPKAENIFKVFNLPLEDVKFIVIGQDPYPQENTATGRSFEIEKNDWKPWINPSLRAILSSIYYHSTSKIKNYEEIVKEIELGNWDIESPSLLFKRLEKEKGVLFLNKSLTCQLGNPNLHSEVWQNFSQKLLQFINLNTKCTWLLWGANAKEAVQLTKLLNGHEVVSTVHPAYWRIVERQASKEEAWKAKKEFIINSGLDLIIK